MYNNYQIFECDQLVLICNRYLVPVLSAYKKVLRPENFNIDNVSTTALIILLETLQAFCKSVKIYNNQLHMDIDIIFRIHTLRVHYAHAAANLNSG